MVNNIISLKLTCLNEHEFWHHPYGDIEKLEETLKYIFCPRCAGAYPYVENVPFNPIERIYLPKEVMFR